MVVSAEWLPSDYLSTTLASAPLHSDIKAPPSLTGFLLCIGSGWMTLVPPNYAQFDPFFRGIHCCSIAAVALPILGKSMAHVDRHGTVWGQLNTRRERGGKRGKSAIIKQERRSCRACARGEPRPKRDRRRERMTPALMMVPVRSFSSLLWAFCPFGWFGQSATIALLFGRSFLAHSLFLLHVFLRFAWSWERKHRSRTPTAGLWLWCRRPSRPPGCSLHRWFLLDGRHRVRTTKGQACLHYGNQKGRDWKSAGW